MSRFKFLFWYFAIAPYPIPLPSLTASPCPIGAPYTALRRNETDAPMLPFKRR